MKKIVTMLFIAAMLFSSAVFALEPVISEKIGPEGVSGEPNKDIPILDMKAMSMLDDQKLVDSYIDVVVEIEAAKMFHSTSGFTPKEYKKYKDLFKYRLQLLFEIHRRKIEIPAEIR